MGVKPSDDHEHLVIAGRELAISNPHKVLFPGPKHTKLDLVHYYLAVAEGALRGAGGRPNVLVRYPNGIAEEFFFQKRAPTSRPPWIEVVSLQFPSGRSADEVVPRDAAALAWLGNLACLDLHPHPVRAEDLDHPDELRVDLDPVPGIEWDQVRQVGQVVEATLTDLGLTGRPRGRAAGAGDRHEQVVEGRAPRRVRGLQPERQGPHGRVGLFGAPDAGRASIGTDRVGRAHELLPRGLHAVDHAGAVRQDRGSPRRYRRSPGLAGIVARALGAARARGDGRCAVAAAMRPRATRG